MSVEMILKMLEDCLFFRKLQTKIIIILISLLTNNNFWEINNNNNNIRISILSLMHLFIAISEKDDDVRW